MLIKANNTNNIYSKRLRSYYKNKDDTGITEVEVEVKVETEIKPEPELPLALALDPDPQCLICLELSNTNNKIIKMYDIKFISPCECNGDFHNKCLFEWFMVSHSCPICREVLIINTHVLEQLQPFYKYTYLITTCKQHIQYVSSQCYFGTVIMTKYIVLIICFKIIVNITHNILVPNDISTKNVTPLKI
jgi:hypothetical protein